MPDYYAILGLPKSCTKDEIKKAYKREALKNHPDKNSSPESEATFKLVSEAYQVLRDDGQRISYDRGQQRPQARFTEPNDIFRDPFGDFYGFDDTFVDPFFSGSNMQHSFSSQFTNSSSSGSRFQSPFGNRMMQSQFQQGGQRSGDFSSSSFSSSAGGSFSQSQQTIIRNGQRETITTYTDAEGNTTVEREIQDQDGSVSIEKTVNGRGIGGNQGSNGNRQIK